MEEQLQREDDLQMRFVKKNKGNDELSKSDENDSDTERNKLD